LISLDLILRQQPALLFLHFFFLDFFFFFSTDGYSPAYRAVILTSQPSYPFPRPTPSGIQASAVIIGPIPDGEFPG